MSDYKPEELRQKPKRNLGRQISEVIFTGGLLLFGFVTFGYYKQKANSDAALERYFSLRGFELSYLQAYHYLLILFWVMVGILVLAVVVELHERWELRDFRRMLANQRKGKNTTGGKY